MATTRRMSAGVPTTTESQGTALTVASSTWVPTFTGDPPTVAGYWALHTEPSGAMTVIGRILPSLWNSE